MVGIAASPFSYYLVMFSYDSLDFERKIRKERRAHLLEIRKSTGIHRKKAQVLVCVRVSSLSCITISLEINQSFLEKKIT